MLVIRLQRIGKKHQPSYRVVAAEKRSKLGGPPAEDLGSYNPFTKKAVFKHERISHWLGVGAKPTPTVHNLLVKNNVITGPKMKIQVNKPEAGVATTPKATESSLEEKVETRSESPVETMTETPAEIEPSTQAEAV